MDCPDVEDLKLQTHADGVRSEWEAYVADCRISNDGKHTKHGLCCDDHGSPLDFPSIVEAFWWATVTMTTVGFGEVYPRTELGRIVATATMLSGILLIALPVAIIGRRFQEVYEAHNEGQLEDSFGDGSASIELISASSKPSMPESDGSSSVAASRSSTSPRPGSQIAPPPPVPTVQASDGPTLTEMSRRLRLMAKNLDPNMAELSMTLAEELDDARDMQREIKSMVCEEKDRQEQVLEQFVALLKRFKELLCENP